MNYQLKIDTHLTLTIMIEFIEPISISASMPLIYKCISIKISITKYIVFS